MLNEAQKNALNNAYEEWKKDIAGRRKPIDFRTWLERKHGVRVSRFWTDIGYVSSEKELMFMLRWS
jgi:hypothetical protein